MTKPFAYISAAWPKDDWLRMRKATNYCRIVAEELLHRSRILVVCGDEVDPVVKNDIALARKWKIAATSLSGIEELNWQKFCE